MADLPRPTDTELLAELAPLAAVIADSLRTVPVRLGPGGADDLISALTIAVALYCGREVLPADALALANPPWPTETDWVVESEWRDGQWRTYGPARRDRDEMREQYHDAIQRNGSNFPYRLVRATTTYVLEAEHHPPEPS